MEFKNKKLGIWGLGVVGTSAVRYFHAQGAQLQVLDNRTLTADEQQFLTEHQVPWFTTDYLPTFLKQNDFILPSPGIDLRPYAAYQSKWLSELDIFRAAYKNPIIAITGSVGKTSVTHLLSSILSTHLRVVTGGNIGTAMFDLLATPSDAAILEVSSFQLDFCQSCAPDLALWTNFHPNHLDRHGTEDGYFRAKCKILMHQKEGQKALIPLSIYNQISAFAPSRLRSYYEVTPQEVLSSAGLRRLDIRANGLNIFSLTKPSDSELNAINPAHSLFYIDNNYIIMRSNNRKEPLIALSDLPETSFTENWLIICAALTILDIPLTVISTIKSMLTIPEHRLEKVATINGVTFYNDSKSTTPQSTLAAITQLQGAAIHLFIGGISKGIDRGPFIENLKGRVKQIYCFGKESEQLYSLCMQASIPAMRSTTLEEAFVLCTQHSTVGEQVVFSPAGASFDLFKDYKERGNRFKELVTLLSNATLT